MMPDNIAATAGRQLFFAAATAGLCLAGCVANPRPDFASVQATIFERTGQEVLWNNGSAEDQQIRRIVQELTAHELTPDQAVQIALLNNLELQATYEDLGIAQADLVQAGLLKNPVLSAEMRFPARPHYPVMVNVEDEFLSIFYLPLQQRIAAANLDQAKAHVTDAVLRRAAEVRAAVYRLQAAQSLAALRATAQYAADASVQSARQLRAAGNISELELANHEILAAAPTLDSAQAKADVLDARENLTMLMGLSGTQADSWSIAAPLPDLPVKNLPDTPALETLALQQRQDLQAARHATLAAAGAASLAETAGMFSGATIGADYVRDADIKSTIGPSISVPLPIFDQGQAAASRAQSLFRQQQDRYLALAIQIRSQVRQAGNQLAAARDKAQYYRDSVIPLRHRIVEQTQLNYNGMFASVFDLLQARENEIDANAHYIEALRDFWIAQTELEQALGGRVPQSSDPTAARTQPATQK